MEWLGWCIFFLIVAAACFAVGGYLAALRGAAAEKKEQKKVKSFGPSVLLLLAGFILSGLSLWWVYKNSVGKAGYPKFFDRSIFLRSLGTGESLSGKKFVNAQNAVDELFMITSKIQPRRGDFLRIVETSTGLDLQIIEPNDTSPK